MSIFNNPDFLALQPLDLENKLFLPTSKLYTQLNLQLDSLYRDARDALGEVHGAIALEAWRLYEQPLVAMTAWHDRAVEFAGETYANIHAAIFGQLLPTAESTYRQLLMNAAEFGRQTQEFWRFFSENPEAVTVSLVESASEYFNAMVAAIQTYLANLYPAISELQDLLLEQPEATLMAFYQNTLSVLLDGYFQIISSFLIAI